MVEAHGREETGQGKTRPLTLGCKRFELSPEFCPLQSWHEETPFPAENRSGQAGSESVVGLPATADSESGWKKEAKSGVK